MMNNGQMSGMQPLNNAAPGANEYDSQNMPLNSQDPKRTYRKKKTWCLNVNITIETPELDHKLNESFEIEIGSN